MCCFSTYNIYKLESSIYWVFKLGLFMFFCGGLTSPTGKEHKGVSVSQEARAEFWSHYWQFRGEHPASCHHNPVGVAGDDARYNLAGQKIIIMMVSLVLHEPQRLEVCRYPFFLLREGLSLGKRTLHDVLKLLAWSLNVGFRGIYPTQGPFGEDFSKRRVRAGGRIFGGPFALSEWRGDWKWHREILDLRQHYSSNCICLFCRATKSRGAFQYARFDVFQQTGFRPFSSAEFVAHALKNYVPPICCIIGFAPRMISLCTMHTSNLGLCSLLNAGALLGLLDRNFFGLTSEPLSHRLRVVTIRFRSWCSAMRIPQSQSWLTVGMLHLSDTAAPELTLKAYHARVFLAFLVVCTHRQLEHCRESNQADDDLLLIHASCVALADWHQHLEASPRYLSEAQAGEMQRLAYKFLVVYKTLAIRHARASSLRFPLRPKHHGFQELNAQMAAERYNMRFRHTFRDEDQMGQVKTIVKGVHKNLLELRTLWRLQLRLKAAPSDLS